MTIAAAVTAAAGLVAVGPDASAGGETCALAPATIVGAGTITGTAGDDVIVGSAGDDTIDGLGGDDIICGDDGADVITDGSGADFVLAGPGDDLLRQGAAVDTGDNLRGEGGTDEISYALRTSGVSVNLDGGGGGVNESDYMEGVENLTGGAGDDSVDGTAVDNVIVTGAGADWVHGEGGNDLVVTGAGDDEGWGDEGDDVIDIGDGGVSHNQGLGGDGNDTITGGTGVDTIFGGPGNDTVSTLAGNDVVYADTGDDTVSDGPGKDKVYLDDGDDRSIADVLKDTNDVVDGGAGSDTADYSLRTALVKLNISNTTADDGAGAEYDRLLAVENLVGGSANDTIVGSTGANTIEGGPGNDTITDGLGPDIVDGGTGDDTILQGAARDVGDHLGGGDGVDTISYALRTGNVPNAIDMDSTTSLVGGSGQQNELDALTSFENAIGGASPDSIYGTDGPNVIKTGNGYNGVYGYDGDDTITTGTSDDLVYDGAGADRVVMGGGCDRVLQQEFDSAGTETDGHSTDYLDGGTGTCDRIDYGDRTDDLSINLGTTAAVNGSVGEADVLKGFENATGGYGDDVIRGNGAANILVGGYGFHTFAAPDDGADTLFGLGGADTLNTYDQVGGNDSADGGFGSDNGDFDAGDSATSVETPRFY